MSHRCSAVDSRDTETRSRVFVTDKPDLRYGGVEDCKADQKESRNIRLYDVACGRLRILKRHNSPLTGVVGLKSPREDLEQVAKCTYRIQLEVTDSDILLR